MASAAWQCMWLEALSGHWDTPVAWHYRKRWVPYVIMDIPINSYSEPTCQTWRRSLQGMALHLGKRWCSEAFLHQKCRQCGDDVVLAAGCQNGLLRDIYRTELPCQYFENIVGFSVKTTQWCIQNLVKFRKRVETKQEDYYKTLWTCNIPTSWLQLEVWWFYL